MSGEVRVTLLDCGVEIKVGRTMWDFADENAGEVVRVERRCECGGEGGADVCAMCPECDTELWLGHDPECSGPIRCDSKCWVVEDTG